MERQDCNWNAGYRFRVYILSSRFNYDKMPSICSGSDESFRQHEQKGDEWSMVTGKIYSTCFNRPVSKQNNYWKYLLMSVKSIVFDNGINTPTEKSALNILYFLHIL
jgi:hypothetical protein